MILTLHCSGYNNASLQPHSQLWPLAHCPSALALGPPPKHEAQPSLRRSQSDPIFCPFSYEPIFHLILQKESESPEVS